MFLYISNATSYSIYDQLFNTGKIKTGYQMQKFNNCMMKGLATKDHVVSLSALPYANVKADRIDIMLDGIQYISVENKTGKLHKIFNVLNLWKEAKKIIKREKPKFIFCDAIALSPRIVTRFLGKYFKIPTVGVITDLPGMLSVENSKPLNHVKSMQGFDYYVLLTEAMNDIVNPYHKPHIVIEGICDTDVPKMCRKAEKKILMYTGSLWKKDAGIEYFTKGFIQADLKDYELHYYGTGELVPWLQKVEKEHPNVRYMGCVTNQKIVALQTEATLLVNPRPSNEEFCKYSFPSKTIEYMLSGTPVLMTKLPGVPEEYFEYVKIIDEESADGVCCTLRSIAEQDDESLNKLGAQAQKFVYNNKNPNKQVSKIIEMLTAH